MSFDTKVKYNILRKIQLAFKIERKIYFEKSQKCSVLTKVVFSYIFETLEASYKM